MNVQPAGGLLEFLQRVPDPRGRTGLRHPLSALLAAVVCATLCGFRGIRPVVHWLELHGVEMWHLLGFRRLPPVRQTFANVLAEVDPVRLEQVLLELIEQLDLPECADTARASAAKSTVSKSAAGVTPAVTAPDVEIWDGKTLRGTRQGERRAEQLLIRIQHTLAKVVSSTAIPRETNESKTAYDLVRQLVLKGKLIVGDAAYCQREICEAIVEKEADYLVTVKGNQPQLLRDIELAFVIPPSFSPFAVREAQEKLQTATTIEKSRGRLETRTVTTTTSLIDEQYLDWPGAQQIIRLERHTVEKGQTRQSVTYAITSLSRDQADAAFLLKHLRGRWHIENRCFYVLDTVLGDDASRTRAGHAAHALTCIRLSTLNLARRLGQTVGKLCREHALKTNLLLNRLRIFKN